MSTCHLVTFDKLKWYIATDLYGMYPTMSNWGMKYILVLFDYKSNNLIAARLMKSHTEAIIIDSYKLIYTELADAGTTPTVQYLDN